MSTPTLSNIEDHLGYWLRCLSNYVTHSFADHLAKYDISIAQWVVLRTLYDASDMTLNETAQAVGVDKSSLSRMVERLVQRGLVTRTEGIDRRSLSLTLSPSGRKLVPKLAQLADANDKAFFSSLSAQEQAKLMDTIKQLLVANGWDAKERGKDRME